MSDRDVEKVYSNAEFAGKLRRLADAVETGKRFEIQIAGERIYVPSGASFSVEHEREGDGEEIEFQIKWAREAAQAKSEPKPEPKPETKDDDPDA